MAPLSSCVHHSDPGIRHHQAEYLRRGIYPGQRLQGNRACRLAACDRSPIREALRQLASDGLVEEFPIGGLRKGIHRPRYPGGVRGAWKAMPSCTRPPHDPSPHGRAHGLSGSAGALPPAGPAGGLYPGGRPAAQAIIRLGGNRVVEQMYERVHSLIQQFRIYSSPPNSGSTSRWWSTAPWCTACSPATWRKPTG